MIFDFDGLILDTEWPAYITVAAAYETHGLELSLADWQERIGRGDNRPWTEDLEIALGRPVDHAAVRAERRARSDELCNAAAVQPGVTGLLRAAHELGLARAVASSSPYSWVGRHLDRLGLLERFGVVRTADDVERTKPWPDVFLAAADGLGVAPRRSIVFEDSAHGVTAAKEAGMYCIAVPNRITDSLDFSDADQVVSSLEHVDLAAVIAAAGAS